jgi:acyl-CoA hydrolase
MAATRHSNRVVATIAVDSLDFRHPVRMGEIVILRAKLTWVGTTSMEVMVDAYAESIKTGACTHTNRAYFTFVALNDYEKPTPVPGLKPETPEEIDQYHQAEERRAQRLHHK